MTILTSLKSHLEVPWVLALATLIATIAAAYVVRRFILGVVGRIVATTESEYDDKVLEILRRPLFLSVILFGVHWIALDLLEPRASLLSSRVIKTVAMWIWALAGSHLSAVVFSMLALSTAPNHLVHRRTVPVFDMLAKMSILGAALYGAFVVWDLDLSAWLASAGIAGIAVGFAAKDTLANLFSGIFIIADAPYKVGDFIVIEGGLRGRVIQMGMRSTRILTRDDLEVTVPNSVIGNHQIINENGGPHPRQRIRVQVSIAYGSDIDRVRDVLLTCVEGVESIAAERTPQVRFRTFGDSGLNFELLVWLEDAERRGRVIDQLNRNVYKALAAAGIEIPYNKLDLFIKEAPRVGS